MASPTYDSGIYGFYNYPSFSSSKGGGGGSGSSVTSSSVTTAPTTTKATDEQASQTARELVAYQQKLQAELGNKTVTVRFDPQTQTVTIYNAAAPSGYDTLQVTNSSIKDASLDNNIVKQLKTLEQGRILIQRDILAEEQKPMFESEVKTIATVKPEYAATGYSLLPDKLSPVEKKIEKSLPPVAQARKFVAEHLQKSSDIRNKDLIEKAFANQSFPKNTEYHYDEGSKTAIAVTPSVWVGNTLLKGKVYYAKTEPITSYVESKYQLFPQPQPTPDKTTGYLVPKGGEYIFDRPKGVSGISVFGKEFQFLSEKGEPITAGEAGERMGVVSGVLGGSLDLFGEAGRVFSEKKGALQFKPTKALKFGINLGQTFLGGIEQGIKTVSATTPEAEQYKKTGMILPYATSLAKFGIATAATGLLWGGVGKIAKAPFKLAYGKDIAPQQFIEVSNLTKLTEGKTQLGSTATSVGKINIMETRRTKGTTISGVAEGDILVIQFDKPIAVKTVVSELTKKGSVLNKQIRQYTGVAVKPLIKELKKSGKSEIESISVPFKVKGVGIVEKQGFFGRKTVETFPIRAKAAGVGFPDIQKYTKTTPMTFVKNIGEKYQLSLGRYSSNQIMGLSAGKSRLLASTPEADLFSGIARFKEYKTGKEGKIFQILKIEKIASKSPKTKGYQFIENPEGATSTITKTIQQVGSQISSNIQSIGEKYASKTQSNYAFIGRLKESSQNIASKQAPISQTIINDKIVFKSGFSLSSASIEQVREKSTQKLVGFNIAKMLSNNKQIQIPLSITKYKTGNYPITMGIQATSEDVLLLSRQKITSLELTSEKIETKTKQTVFPITKTIPKQPPNVPIIEMPKIKIPKIPIIDYPQASKKQIAFGLISEETGYDVYARSKGNFQKLNKKPISKIAARNLGGSATDNSAAATFKIKKTNKPAQQGEDLGGFNAYKFQQIQANPTQETYREKNTYRIDTSGEIKGISAKGWIANRRKTLMKNIGIMSSGKSGIMGF